MIELIELQEPFELALNILDKSGPSIVIALMFLMMQIGEKL